MKHIIRKALAALLTAALGRVLEPIPHERIEEFKRGFLLRLASEASELAAATRLDAPMSEELRERILTVARAQRDAMML